MVDYTVIADSEIDPESPGTTTLFTKLRDNPIAIAEGAPGAPRIGPGALAGSGDWIYAGDEGDGAITYTSNTSIDPGEYHHSTFQVNSGVTLSLNGQGPLIIRATESITIIGGGTIDVNARGGLGGSAGATNYGTGGAGQAGAGGGSGGGGGGSNSCGGGGGVGGDGGDSEVLSEIVAGGAGGACGGANDGVIGNVLTDIAKRFIYSNGNLALLNRGQLNYGGGGGGGGAGGDVAGTTQDGGNGGGFILLIAPVIDFRTGAIINANGGNGGGGVNLGGGSGGGGGGCVLFAGTTITNNGTINVNGGGIGTNVFNDGGPGAAGYSDVITV